MSQILYNGDGYGEELYGDRGYGHPQKAFSSGQGTEIVYGEFGYTAKTGKLFLESFGYTVEAPKIVTGLSNSLEASKVFNEGFDKEVRADKVFGFEDVYRFEVETSNERLVKILEIL